MIDEKEQQKQKGTSKQNCKKVENYIFSYDWKLGSGSFSQVFKAIDCRNNNTVAVKVIKIESITSKVALTLLQQEISILKQLDHVNVIKCYDVMNSTNNCYIVTEFCPFGDLEKLLRMKRKFSQREIDSFVYHIYKGLKYLAEKKIIHRDFKVANVFVGEGGICKIADFGFATKSDGQMTDISLGSPIYMSPQAIIKKEYGPKTDVWAFGALIYELIVGKPPLSGVKTQQELLEKIVLPPPLITEPISSELRDFIDRCLTVLVKDRISIWQMQNHRYIRQIVQKFQPEKMSTSGSMSDIVETTKNSENTDRLLHGAFQYPISYEQSVSILQYCRLLFKFCSCVKSQVLQKWLIILITEIKNTKLKDANLIDYKNYKETVEKYYGRFKKECKSRGKVTVFDVLKECENMLIREKKYQQQVRIVGAETSLLKDALGHPLKLVYFSKVSKSAKYMES